MEILISETGKQHGYGTDGYKWVSGLTGDERAAAMRGDIVIITGSRPCHEVPEPLRTVRMVKYDNGRYRPRMVRGVDLQSAVRARLA